MTSLPLNTEQLPAHHLRALGAHRWSAHRRTVAQAAHVLLAACKTSELFQSRPPTQHASMHIQAAYNPRLNKARLACCCWQGLPSWPV